MSFLGWRDNGKHATMSVSNPLARSENLVVEELDGEVLIYDQVSNHAHCLGPAAAAVWRACDGKTKTGDLGEATGLDADTVKVALGELESKNLLDVGPMLGNGTTRREFSFRAAKVGAFYSSCDCNSCTGICGCCCCCQTSECKYCSSVGFCSSVTCTNNKGGTYTGNCSAGPNTPPQHCVNPVCTFGANKTIITCTPSCPSLTAKGGCGCTPSTTVTCT
jgi:hypothetical protein